MSYAEDWKSVVHHLLQGFVFFVSFAGVALALDLPLNIE